MDEQLRQKYVPKYEKKAQTERWFWHSMVCDMHKGTDRHYFYVDRYLKSLINPKGGQPIKDNSWKYHNNKWIPLCNKQLDQYITEHPQIIVEQVDDMRKYIWNENAWLLQSEIEQIIEDAGYGHEGGHSFELGSD